MNKNFSIYSHALHSRLQMIRNKLDVNPKMSPSDVVVRNQKYFERAGASVNQQHECRCGRSEYYEAAEILLITVNAEGKDPTDLPLWTRQKQ